MKLGAELSCESKDIKDLKDSILGFFLIAWKGK